MTKNITGRVADFEQKIFYPAEISFSNGKISGIRKLSVAEPAPLPYLLPGFIDSHVHIESSMLVPSEFARLAVVHGTIAAISDPHEIANVCGMKGVEYMMENGKQVPFYFYFGAPSCVPATIFETAGAALNAEEVTTLLARPDIKYLSEMMNFPGVLQQDPEVIKKIAAAQRYGKPVDGHAPGLRGENARRYIAAGISTDHECFTEEEAREKLEYGMKILIREGSAAKNFDALIPLLHEYPDHIMFCSDDKHPDSLALGHINQLCARAVAAGIDVFKVLQAACINPVLHYQLETGLLREGDPANLVLVEDLTDFRVLQTYIRGERVAEHGKSTLKRIPASPINNFSCREKRVEDFRIFSDKEEETITVIGALDGQLITEKLQASLPVKAGELRSRPEADILKITVVNRYEDSPPAMGFIQRFGIKNGALASSVAHDSHNIVAVGTDDESICRAVNLVIREKGGISVVSGKVEKVLGLPVAGLMTQEDGYAVAERYTELDTLAKEGLGSSLRSPFMTLSFMALLVIPHVKLSDKGLFDGDGFQFIG